MLAHDQMVQDVALRPQNVASILSVVAYKEF